jgi:hypothetical protein
MSQENERQEERLKKSQKFNKFLFYFSILIILVGISLICYYHLTHEVLKCTSNPLKYLSEQEIYDFGLNYTFNYSYAKVYLFYDENDTIPAKIVEFSINQD